ncbi:MAG: hypothetical protein J3K34DRAFT_428732 [Monoraphidium minutum]|nr:MAG: hypothetical protein J3K34DRAFT_428732 [Monoraphidium minutum]
MVVVWWLGAGMVSSRQCRLSAAARCRRAGPGGCQRTGGVRAPAAGWWLVAVGGTGWWWWRCGRVSRCHLNLAVCARAPRVRLLDSPRAGSVWRRGVLCSARQPAWIDQPPGPGATRAPPAPSPPPALAPRRRRGELPLLRDGTSTEALALEGLARRCKAALAAYPKDAAADQRLAAAVPDGGGYAQREALCAAVRLRERAVLARAEFVALQRAKAARRARQGR